MSTAATLVVIGVLVIVSAPHSSAQSPAAADPLKAGATILSTIDGYGASVGYTLRQARDHKSPVLTLCVESKRDTIQANKAKAADLYDQLKTAVAKGDSNTASLLLSGLLSELNAAKKANAEALDCFGGPSPPIDDPAIVEVCPPPEYNPSTTFNIQDGAPAAAPESKKQNKVYTGTGWPPNVRITVGINGMIIATVLTDAKGDFTISFLTPFAVRPGNATATAGDSCGGPTLSSNFFAFAPLLICTPTTLSMGDELTCTAGAFDAKVAVRFQINPLLGSAITDDEGIATLVARIPEACAFANGQAAGRHPVTAGGVVEGQSATASAEVTITNASGTCASRLPTTGLDSERLIGIALALIAVGGLVILKARQATGVSARLGQ